MKRHVGSVFAADPAASTRTSSRDVETSELFESAGQVLRRVCRDAWQGGARRLVFPAYFCESMLHPFDEFPWDIRFYGLDQYLKPSWPEIRDLLDEGEALVLVAEFFGNRIDRDLAVGLAEVVETGVRVIEDWTHSWLSRPKTPIDIALASLRKTIPVGDGCRVWTRGCGALVPERSRIDGPGVDMWAAMDMLAVVPEADEVARARALALAADAETRFAVELEPAAATVRSATAEGQVDEKQLAAKRQSNAVHLASRLNAFTHVNGDLTTNVPSHLVLRIERPRELQAALAERGIYCPIHWTRTDRAPSEFAWHDLISIPIDHRYDLGDMDYVADVLGDLRG